MRPSCGEALVALDASHIVHVTESSFHNKAASTLSASPVASDPVTLITSYIVHVIGRCLVPRDAVLSLAQRRDARRMQCQKAVSTISTSHACQAKAVTGTLSRKSSMTHPT